MNISKFRLSLAFIDNVDNKIKLDKQVSNYLDFALKKKYELLMRKCA